MNKRMPARTLLTSNARVATLIAVGVAETACNLQAPSETGRIDTTSGMSGDGDPGDGDPGDGDPGDGDPGDGDPGDGDPDTGTDTDTGDETGTGTETG